MARLGEIIDGKYEILREVGRGGMSVVYLAMDKRLNKQWAVKEYKQDGQFSQLAKESLLKEASLMKKLDHPRLPRIVDIIEIRSSIYVVMDYIEGEPLNKVLDAYGAQPQEVVVEWGLQLADVLDYLHTLSPPIIYRDMKPSNIMLKPDGTIRLFDFGIAKEIEEDSDGGTTVGTRGYAAPEQFSKDQRIDGRTDIYALGVTLYHLVTGKNPAEPPYELYPIRHWDPKLSSGLEWLIQKCTQLNPGDRYQSCAEVTYVLENLEKFEAAYKARQRRKRNAFITTSALTLVFAIVGSIGLIMKNVEYKNSLEKHRLDGDYTYCIDREPQNTEYYTSLVDSFMEKFKDGKETFNATEEEKLKAALTQDHLSMLNKADPDGYIRLNYELGRLYWNYYEDVSKVDQVRMDDAKKHFAIVLKAADNGDTKLTKSEINQANAYYTLAFFGTPEARKALNGDLDAPIKDREGNPIENPVKEYWNAIENVMTLIENNQVGDLPNIVKLTSLKAVAYMLQSDLRFFKQERSGFSVSADQMDGVYNRLLTMTAAIDTNGGSKLETIKQETEGYLKLFKNNIEANYRKGAI